VFLGIALGLVVGKPLGILGACLAGARITARPSDVTRAGLAVMGAVAGIGFTMALFIAQLAFPPGAMLETAKLAILVGSLVAATVGLAIGRLVLRPAATPSA